LFCNEMLGLGHLRLSLALASEIVRRDRASTALVATGSPAFAGIPVPDRVDLLKLPTLPVGSHSRWSDTTMRPPTGLTIPEEQIVAMRARLSLAAAQELRPDIAIVDYRPVGRGGDLRDTLEWLRTQGGCTNALGLWDVDDDPARLGQDWTEELASTVAELYDLALFYGPPDPDDLRLTRLRAAGVPVHATALVAEPPSASPPSDLGDGYLLVTTGGGIDGGELLYCVLRSIALRPPGVAAVLVTGPMMPAAEVRRLRAAADELDALVVESRPDMADVLAGARAVIAMAGYNTVAEVIASGAPTLLVPRTFPRREQLNRARRWAEQGRIRMLDPDELDPARLADEIEELLRQPRASRQEATGAQDAIDILEAARGRTMLPTSVELAQDSR
jgi:predicted glycosyltransferase